MARRLAALSAACSALFGPAAAADDVKWKLGAGLFIGYAWGARPGLLLGAEVFGMHFLNAVDPNLCLPQPQQHYGLGPLLQVATVAGDFQITLAAQAGAELVPGVMGGQGELGATHRFGVEGGTGLHTGVAVSSYVTNFAWRGEWGINQMSLTGGLRVPPLYEFTHVTCIGGRPFRTSTGDARHTPHARRFGTTTSRPRGEERWRAGAAWARDAADECASIPAFLQLAAELLAFDAPPALVDRALDAARDEIGHAAICARVASHYAGETIRPVLPDMVLRPHLSGSAGYVRLGVESWLDGCLGEGAAAGRAALAERIASDPIARTAKRQIARDERRHAELGWAILRWAIDRAGDVVRDAVGDLRGGEWIASAASEPGLTRYGCLESGPNCHAGESVAAACRRRLEAMLGAGPSGQSAAPREKSKELEVFRERHSFDERTAIAPRRQSIDAPFPHCF